ncbi:MAG TPA: S8 family serine peptidase, partial [Blastocatellia bacterium]
PIFIPGEENKNGVRFFKPAGNQFQADMIPAQQAVHAGYPEIPGVIVVGAMSSLKRKAFYSNWGRQLTVVAPSGNAIIRLGKEPGRGVIAANNRPGIGVPFPSSSGFDFEYTNRFGGTSAAAPIVAGVIGLMLSVNPSLRPEQVREILKETADIAELEFDLDMNEVTLRDFIEKNLQDFNRQFVSGHSILFGGGKVDADKAVQKAIDLLAAIQ